MIAGHSDQPVIDNIVDQYPNVKTWWGVNSQSLRVRGLPLGITNNCDEGPIYRIYGNTDIMHEVVREPR